MVRRFLAFAAFSVFLEVRGQELLGVLRDFPGLRPKAKVHGEPLALVSSVLDNGVQDLAEVDLPLAEGTMGARLVSVQGAVRVDDMDMPDFSLEHSSELGDAALERFFLFRLASPYHPAHVSVAGVKEDVEVRVVDFLHEAHDLRGLVEEEAWLELPHHLDAFFLCQAGTLAPELDDAASRGVSVHPGHPVGSADRVNTKAGCSEVRAKLQVLLEEVDVIIVLLSCVGSRTLVPPKIGRQARDAQAVFLDEALHLLTVGIRWVIVRMDVWLECADLHPVVL